MAYTLYIRTYDDNSLQAVFIKPTPNTFGVSGLSKDLYNDVRFYSIRYMYDATNNTFILKPPVSNDKGTTN